MYKHKYIHTPEPCSILAEGVESHGPGRGPKIARPRGVPGRRGDFSCGAVFKTPVG